MSIYLIDQTPKIFNMPQALDDNVQKTVILPRLVFESFFFFDSIHLL